MLGRSSSAASGAAEQKPGPSPSAKADPKRAPRKRVRKVGGVEVSEGTEAQTLQSEGAPAAATGSSNELVKEAIDAIKSLRISKLCAVKAVGSRDAVLGLLDGGATTSLRQAISVQEWEAAAPVVVHLAS